MTEEYVILQGNGGDNLGEGDVGEKKVYGLWIFEEEGGSTKGVRERCGKCIVECAESAGEGDGGGLEDGHARQGTAAGGDNGLDLMALLNPSRGHGAS